MSRYQNRPELLAKLNKLNEGSTILDIGGWFDPLNLATHVVDLFPYETRRCKLSLSKEEEEVFSRDTWFQKNFLSPDLKLPFSDNFFDFVVCCHTLEDLENPLYLLSEIERIGKAGYIEVPSRLDEQTMGIRDRISDESGHPHHHWIIDNKSNTLEFYNKRASLAKDGWQIPLTYSEDLYRVNPRLPVLEFYFEGSFNFRIIPQGDKVNEIVATKFRNNLNISTSTVYKDKALRLARKTRNYFQNKSEDYSWYDEIVRISEPYSTIPLK